VTGGYGESAGAVTHLYPLQLVGIAWLVVASGEPLLSSPAEDRPRIAEIRENHVLLADQQRGRSGT
jgi:hypothetical protein